MSNTYNGGENTSGAIRFTTLRPYPWDKATMSSNCYAGDLAAASNTYTTFSASDIDTIRTPFYDSTNDFSHNSGGTEPFVLVPIEAEAAGRKIKVVSLIGS